MATPYYLYNLTTLKKTVGEAKKHCGNIKIHYALKANYDHKILEIISGEGIGAEVGSKGELLLALKYFKAKDIIMNGCGKTIDDIISACENNIGCINIENSGEAKHIREGQNVAIRINPNIESDTHSNISTGHERHKFGIDIADKSDIFLECDHLNILGFHYHIGSNIKAKEFIMLANMIKNISSQGYVNIGGGLGIDYRKPEKIANFKEYFAIYNSVLKGYDLHCELGRSLVAGCGRLYTKVLYMKKGYVIVDTGMNDMMRHALYGSYHKIENTVKRYDIMEYEVAGGICESTDTFGKHLMTEARVGDILCIHSAGAYGQTMANNYGLKKNAITEYLW